MPASLLRGSPLRGSPRFYEMKRRLPRKLIGAAITNLPRRIGDVTGLHLRVTINGMLHGRRAECAVIDRLLADAGSSRSGALVLRGEAGVGKSALLADALRAALRHDSGTRLELDVTAR